MTTDNNEKNTRPSRVEYTYDDNDYRGRADVPQIMRNIFGVFMILIYVGMGVALFLNLFQFDPRFDWVRYVGGTLFIIYGFWRGYRQVKGMY